MKSGLILFLGFISMTQPMHVSHRFQFVVRAPLVRAAVLFGPNGERCWAGPNWNPEFLYPQPGKDTQGAVFTVQHGPHKSVWVNTVFDPAAGRMQYVVLHAGDTGDHSGGSTDGGRSIKHECRSDLRAHCTGRRCE